MKIILIALLALTILADNPFNIDVYIESQCPDCIQFIQYSLAKALKTPDFEKIANVRLIPYGNARQTYRDGTWQFTCQHGTVECYGNLLENCAMAHIDNPTDKLKFVECVENNIGSRATVQKFDQVGAVCSQKFNLSYTVVQNCMTTNEGNQLQHQAADETDALQPAHQWVPWIVVNGKHDANVENAIIDDIVTWVCQNYQGQTIDACNYIAQ